MSKMTSLHVSSFSMNTSYKECFAAHAELGHLIECLLLPVLCFNLNDIPVVSASHASYFSIRHAIKA